VIVIIRKSRNNVILRITSKIHFKNIIIPIFDKYPMLTAKHWDYINFRNNLLENIILYNDLKPYNRPNLTPFESVEKILALTYFNDWLVGFIEAEGCFTVYKPFYSSCNIVSFEIRQTNGFQVISAIL
jgi:ubiquinol-cytochrome c reductase cytochrome b subunit